MTDHPEPMELRRKRLLHRSRYMGSNENDLLIGGFAEENLANLSNQEIADLEKLIEQDDADIYNWVTGRTPVPPEHDTPLMDKLRAYRPPCARRRT